MKNIKVFTLSAVAKLTTQDQKLSITKQLVILIMAISMPFSVNASITFILLPVLLIAPRIISKKIMYYNNKLRYEYPKTRKIDQCIQ